jgi:hypothetical protein
MLGSFNQGLWEKCFSMIDPVLRSKVEFRVYADRLKVFQKTYGVVRPWHIRISLHMDASSNNHDDRSFAYVYIVWQDDAKQFHIFRERWVKDKNRWFTRVVGLVPN